MHERGRSAPPQAWTGQDDPEHCWDAGFGPCELGVPGWADYTAARERFLARLAAVGVPPGEAGHTVVGMNALHDPTGGALRSSDQEPAT